MGYQLTRILPSVKRVIINEPDELKLLQKQLSVTHGSKLYDDFFNSNEGQEVYKDLQFIRDKFSSNRPLQTAIRGGTFSDKFTSHLTEAEKNLLKAKAAKIYNLFIHGDDITRVVLNGLSERTFSVRIGNLNDAYPKG